MKTRASVLEWTGAFFYFECSEGVVTEKITGRFVIYRGEDAEADGIRYINVEEYLKGLGMGSCGK